MTYEVLGAIKLKIPQGEIDLRPGQLIKLDHGRAVSLIEKGKIRELLPCERCPAGAWWESPQGKGWHCFSYAYFYPVRGGKPKLCEEAIKDCGHKDNIETLRGRYRH